MIRCRLDVEDVAAWHAEIRRQARANTIKVRGGVNDGIVWALRLRSGQPEWQTELRRYGARLAAELIAAADVTPGQRALDVGCGLGALTIELAGLLGEARVAAVDPSDDAVKTCRARVSEAEVIVAPVEELSFSDQSFDAVLAQLVINLVADPEAGAREMRRVARPGGVVAACVWDANAMPLLSSFWEAAAQVAPTRLAPSMSASRSVLEIPAGCETSGGRPACTRFRSAD